MSDFVSYVSDRMSESVRKWVDESASELVSESYIVSNGRTEKVIE